MPFYVGDYLGDTQRLTTEQHGAYLLLILDYWRAGPPPDDDEVLRQITKLEAKVWKRHRLALVRMFQIEGGQWRHRRIDRELENASSNAERRSEKARKGANARWGHSSTDAPSNAPSMPEAVLVECAPQSPSPKEESPNGDLSKTALPFDPNDLVEAWNEMAERKALPAIRGLTPTRLRQIKARIREFPDIADWQLALDAIERSEFLCGADGKWRANFDFLLQPSSFQKLIEGTYDGSISQRRH
jgi:uncharacterized protein YdaU (DUF1376 family)